ncbi:MAG: prepilin-type N-terminal cleavage/methylation domain-containing protein [Clostridia bacterium]|nr:prepilin-type N-terminal cleavage/methylation domain-containing protein [Clostridia bacterium]
MKGNIFQYCVKDHRGVTLTELLVSITILVIVTVPFLSSFLAATENNVLSKDKLDAANLAQKAMEEIKSKPGFLNAEALGSPDFKIYLEDGQTTVKYKIRKIQDGSLPSDNTAYAFNSLDSLNFPIHCQIDEAHINLNGFTFDLLGGTGTENAYCLDFSGGSGIYAYQFYTEGNVAAPVALNGIGPDEPIRVKIQFLNNTSESHFNLSVDLDAIMDDREVYFYIVDNKTGIGNGNGRLNLENRGKKTFYVYNNLTSNEKQYLNVLYEVEVVVENSGDIMEKLVSYVKK